MARTITLPVDIPSDHKIEILLPMDIPAGPATIILSVPSPGENQECTLGEFASSEFFGIWRDREDINDSAEYARQLRRRLWERKS